MPLKVRLSAIVTTALFLGACSRIAPVTTETAKKAIDDETPIVVTVSDLVTNPTKFAGKRVQVTGYWIQSFEYSALHIGQNRTETSPIWVERWSLPGARKVENPQSISAAIEAAYKQVGRFRHQTRDVLLVTLEGYFDHKVSMPITKETYPFQSGYGHLGQYSSLFTIERVIDARVVSQEPTNI